MDKNYVDNLWDKIYEGIIVINVLFSFRQFWIEFYLLLLKYFWGWGLGFGWGFHDFFYGLFGVFFHGFLFGFIVYCIFFLFVLV